MISSVTTTVSTIVSSVAAIGLIASIGIAAVITLIVSLVMKELATGEGPRVVIFGHNLDVAILPLLFVFLFIVSIKVWGILA